MKNMRSAYIVGHSGHVGKMFRRRGWLTVNVMKYANLVVFTGGEDINPLLYGEKAHLATRYNPDRDDREIFAYKKAKEFEIPMLGICRGAQLLNVMCGGQLFQHISAHSEDHVAKDYTNGNIIWVSSTHHQMMMPADGAQVLLTANESLFRHRMPLITDKGKDPYDCGPCTEDDPDIEALWYPGKKILCIQGHPEYTQHQHFTDWTFQKINQLLL